MDQPNTNLDTFCSAQTFCAHHSAKILSNRGYINALALESRTPADAGAMIWSRIVKKSPEQRNFWENSSFEIKSTLAFGMITAARLVGTVGLPARQAEYRKWAAKAAEALIAVIKAEVEVGLKKKAEVDEFELAEFEAARCEARYALCGRYSPVSPIDPKDLAMVDWDGPEPSVRRPSPVLPVWGGHEEEQAAEASYLDLDSLAPLVQMASTERLTPVKARIVDR
jgi:hypothetical protein